MTAGREAIAALIGTERFGRAWVRLDDADEINRHSALEGVRRMLAAQGITMADVLELARRSPNAAIRPSPTTTPEPARPSPRPFAPRDDREGRVAFLEETAETLLSGAFLPVKGQRAVSGASVPRSVVGRVELLSTRTTPFGEVVAFAMRTSDNVYGPIAALDPITIELLRSGHEEGAAMVVQTLPPHGRLSHPSATRAAVRLR